MPPDVFALTKTVVQECEVCVSLMRPALLPLAGRAQPRAFNDIIQAGLLFLPDAIVLHIMEIFTLFYMLARLPSKEPAGARNAFL